MILRAATIDDVPALRRLIEESVRKLSTGFYNSEQIDAALSAIFGVDTQLIDDGTYYTIEGEGTLAAAGGWSARRTLYGGDQMKRGADPLLDPAVDPARIRAFFVHPGYARRGLARQLYETCERSARSAGFRSFELMATMSGVPLYAALGFAEVEHVATIVGGVEVPFVRMSRDIASLGAHVP